MNLKDRLNSVNDTSNEKKLKNYALNDPSDKVREIAVSKIKDQIVLAYIAQNDESIDVVKNAVLNINDEYQLKNVIIYLMYKKGFDIYDIVKENIHKITDLSNLMEILMQETSLDVKNSCYSIILDRIREVDSQILFVRLIDFKILTTQLQLEESLLNGSLKSDREIEKCISAITDQNILVRLISGHGLKIATEAVRHIINQDILKEIASSENYFVARGAIKIINDEIFLKEFALNENDRDLKLYACENISDNDILKEIILKSPDVNVKNQAIESIDDQTALLDLALHSNYNEAASKLNHENQIFLDALKKEVD